MPSATVGSQSWGTRMVRTVGHGSDPGRASSSTRPRSGSERFSGARERPVLEVPLSAVEGRAMPLRDDPRAAGVIEMAVCDEDVVDAAMADPSRLQACRELPDREPRVEQDQSLVGAQERGVSSAPRSEHAQAHGQGERRPSASRRVTRPTSAGR